MSVKFANNAFGTLNAGISNSATSLTLSSGQGARFPTLASGEYFYATLIDTSNNLEVVKCTARSTDVLTVTRAQESTSAQAFAIGDRVELRITAGGLADVAALATLDADASPSLSANLDLNSNDIVDGSTLLLDATRIRVPSASSNLSSPAAGDMYYNTTDKVIKHYDGTTWIQMSNSFSADGGNVVNTYTDSGVTYKYHVFTSSGTFTTTSIGNVDVLVVAGGGGGGTLGGGGGAGGMLVQTNVSVAAQAYSITVGGGGTNGSQGNAGSQGSNSVALGYTAIGGGGGGSHTGGSTSAAGTNGGSGGGGSDNNSSAGPGSGTSGQGNNGGAGSNAFTDNPRGGGGGGGKGAAGTAIGSGGHGGVGGQNSYYGGNNYYYAGGGGYSPYGSSQNAGNGGLGGGGGGGSGAGSNTGNPGSGGGSALNTGGAGNSGDGVAGGSGGANTGGGAGCNSWSLAGSAAGGSGIVIIRYSV